MTQGFRYDSAEQAEARFDHAGADEFIYARYGNPTTRIFEERMSAIEGTEDAFATASGMAAIHGALFALIRPGDRVVAARALFGSSLYLLDLLSAFDAEVTLLDASDLTAWQEALSRPARVVFFETLSNPTLEVIDVEAVSRLAHAAGALVLVDNVFATPVFSQAVKHGADLVLYSATKHIDGSGRAMGGLILGSRKLIREDIEPFVKHTGGAISPFNAWLMLGGLTTMDLRVRAMAESAAILARHLAGQDGLRVIYPGLSDHPQHDLAMRQIGTGGTMIAIETPDKDAAFRLLDGLRVVSLSNNLGDARSIATHPATTTHHRLTEDERAALGITPGMIRLSVGLEDSADLVADFDAALRGM